MSQQKTVLIVEDEAALRKALSHKLSLSGYAILEAKNGSEGLALALEKKPDLILLDIVMPVMDGLSMLHELRQDAWGRDAAVILLTNLSEQQKVATALVEGVHDYLVKSDWSIEDILKTVNNRLGETVRS